MFGGIGVKIKKRFKDKVLYLLEGQHHLIPIFSNVYYIPERIHEYDDSFFVVYNTKYKRFEIHCVDHAPFTHAVTIPHKELDVRAIQHLWYNDIRTQGDKVIKRAIQFEEKKEKEEKRDYQNWVRDVARETQSEFAKDAWTFGT